MKKLKLLLATMLLGASGMAAATGTTVLDQSGTLSGLFSLDSYGFTITSPGTYDTTFATSSTGGGFNLAGYVIDESIGGKWVTVGDGGIGTNSFTGSAGKYIAIIGDIAFPAKNVNFTIDVTKVPSPVPEPETWAIMLLGIGFVVYQARPRKNRGSTAIPHFS
jgi:hypothetical protein